MQDAALSRRAREAESLHRAWLVDNDGPAVDKNLFALAQLAAFRARKQRAIISLVDTETQYILVEAATTPTLETLLLGVTTLPLADALCDPRLFEDRASRHGAVNEDASDHFVSRDCQGDDRFKNHALVNKEHGARYAAGVPLVSKNSGTIGALVVLDDSPGSDMQDEEIEMLKDCAQSVVRHLELVRSTVDPSREVAVLRGIVGSFANQYMPPADTDATTGEQGSSEEQQLERPEANRPGSHKPSDEPSRPRSMEDSLLSAFNSVANVLRQVSFADGVVVFGPHPVSKLIFTEAMGNGIDGEIETTQAHPIAHSLQEGHTCPALEERKTPSVRTLRRLAAIYPRGMAFNVTGKVVKPRNAPNDQSELPYTALAMDNDNVAQKEEGDDLGSLHEEVLETLAEAQTLVFLPVYDHDDSTLLAACFMWDSSGFRMANGNHDVSEYRMLGNFLSHSVAQVRMQSKDAEQSKFMSNFSHELRSPIHGILGSAQFLQDTISDDYQNSLLQAIVVSSNTLLDTLNVVLDYTKYENAMTEVKQSKSIDGPDSASPATIQPFRVQADIDLALLVEDAVETVVAGHFFDNLPNTSEKDPDLRGTTRRGSVQEDRGSTQDVKVILEIAARPSWSVQTSPGAISRIMMNLVGNALKFTHKGSIKIALKPQDHEDPSKINARIEVEDTGIGMDEHFRKNHLFAPYRQENQFSPGVGLGMSVLKHMVASLNGTINVNSEREKGTTVDIDLTFEASQNPEDGIPSDLADDLQRIRGKHLVLLDLSRMYDGHSPSDSVMAREQALRSVASNWLGMTVSTTSDINGADADFYLFSEPPPADNILEHYNKAAKSQSTNMEIPLVIVTTDSREAHLINKNHARSLEQTGRIVQVLSQPCGPRKLAKVLNLCLDRAAASKKERAKKGDDCSSESQHKPSGAEPDTKRDQYGNAEDGQDLEQVNGPPSVMAEEAAPKAVSKSPAQEKTNNAGDHKGGSSSADNNPQKGMGDDEGYFHPTEDPKPPFSKPLVINRKPEDTPAAQRKEGEKRKAPRGLMVDDNKVNLRLLVTLMVKQGYTYEQAENGQEALDAFKACSGTEPNSDASRVPFDFVLMDIGMPLMNGLQCTRAIREHEKTHGLEPVYIIACTAWNDAKTQQEAEEAGIDLFMPKPLKFANLMKDLARLREEMWS